jgi:hypothetical protein
MSLTIQGGVYYKSNGNLKGDLIFVLNENENENENRYFLRVDKDGKIFSVPNAMDNGTLIGKIDESSDLTKIPYITISNNTITLMVTKNGQSEEVSIPIQIGGGKLRKKYNGHSYLVREGKRGGKFILVKGKKIYV